MLVSCAFQLPFHRCSGFHGERVMHSISIPVLPFPSRVSSTFDEMHAGYRVLLYMTELLFTWHISLLATVNTIGDVSQLVTEPPRAHEL